MSTIVNKNENDARKYDQSGQNDGNGSVGQDLRRSECTKKDIPAAKTET